MSRLLGTFFLTFLFAGALLLPFGHAAQAQTDVESGYNQVFGSKARNIAAQGIIFANICQTAAEEGREDTCTCRASGQCSLGDVMQVFVNISIVILGVSGSIVLVMFVYGGLLWILAAGDEKRLTEGKDTMTHAVIGLVIIFGAYAFVNFIIAGIAGQLPSSTIEDTIDNLPATNADGTPAK
jgi:hypothetical protein